MSVSGALAPLSNALSQIVEPLIPFTAKAIAHAVPFLEQADRVAKVRNNFHAMQLKKYHGSSHSINPSL